MTKYDSFHPPVDSLVDALSTMPSPSAYLTKWDTMMNLWIPNITANTALKVGSDSMRKFFVYYEGDEQASGQIDIRGMHDRHGNVGEPKFVVFSRTIENNKYSNGNLQYSKATAHIDISIKNIRRYCTPLVTTELRYTHKKGYRATSNHYRQVIQRQYQSALEGLDIETTHAYKCFRKEFTLPLIVRYFSDVRNLDMDFGNVKEQVDALLLSVDSVKAERQSLKERTVMFCRVRSIAGEQVCEILPLGPEEEDWREASITDEVPVVLPVEALSPRLIEKLAVLNTLESGTYLHDVGYKSPTENIFFIENGVEASSLHKALRTDRRGIHCYTNLSPTDLT